METICLRDPMEIQDSEFSSWAVPPIPFKNSLLSPSWTCKEAAQSFLQWRDSRCNCSVSVSAPSPCNSFHRETCPAKSHPGLEAAPHWTFYPCSWSVEGSKLCFSVSNVYLFDLGLHILQRTWNIPVDCCAPWCVQTTSVLVQPQPYKEK